MIPTHPFGRTGHDSTRVIFGAAALGNVSQGDADRTMELIMEHGINHIDTAASYREAELRLGPWLAEHRDRFFVATKTGERAYCLIGEWDSFEALVAARPQLIAGLDGVRAMLEDLGHGLGVTDPVSGDAVLEFPSR